MNRPDVVRSPLLGMAALASGAALVASIALHVSLAWTFGSFALFAGLLVAFRISLLSPPLRTRLKVQALAGAKIGFVATLGYDISRYLLVTVARLDFWPFETFVFFGYALIGEQVSRSAALLAGTAYHFVNGIGFAVAFCLMLAGRHWLFGLAWALGLEVAMFTLYPGWLDLDAVMVEFTAVSMTGHLTYGAILGLLSQRWFGTRRHVQRGTV